MLSIIGILVLARFLAIKMDYDVVDVVKLYICLYVLCLVQIWVGWCWGIFKNRKKNDILVNINKLSKWCTSISYFYSI